MGEKRNAYRILVGMPEGKRQLGRPRRRWVDNIKMAAINLRVPYNAGKFLSSCTIDSFLRKAQLCE
jgi:hypothetical protein